MWPLTFTPRCLRRAPQRRGGYWPARVFAPGEAGCRSVHRQARDGLSMDPAPAAERRAPAHRASSFAMGRRKLRERLFWLLLELLPKVTRRRRKTSLRRQEDPARAQAHTAQFQRVGGQILRCAQNDKGERLVLAPRYARWRGHSGRTELGAFHVKSTPPPNPPPPCVGGGGKTRRG